MARTAQNFISYIQPLIRDRTGGTVIDNDIIQALNRAADRMRTDHGILVTKGRADLKVYPGVYEYAAPTGFQEPIALFDRTNPLKLVRKSPSEFWLRLDQEDNIWAIDAIEGTKFLLVSRDSAGSSVDFHDCDSLTDNGTWSADTGSSDAVNLTSDSATFKKGSASLNFDIDVSQSGNNYAAISISDASAVDASDMEDVGALFGWFYFPAVTHLSSVTARWGDDSSNYWEVTATTSANGQSFRAGWNRLKFSWDGASETGSPTSSSVNYLYLRITYTASQTDDTDFCVDDLFFAEPETYELAYYTNYIAEDTSGNLLDYFTSTDDTSILEDEYDDILLFWALADCWRIFDRMDMAADAEARGTERLRAYKGRNPSEIRLPIARYY